MIRKMMKPNIMTSRMALVSLDAFVSTKTIPEHSILPVLGLYTCIIQSGGSSAREYEKNWFPMLPVVNIKTVLVMWVDHDRMPVVNDMA